MKFVLAILVFIAMSSFVHAHEMTPTYIEITSSHIDGVATSSVKLFNRRVDVEYYEISVFDEEWNSIPFAASNRVIQLNYLETKNIEVYFRDVDRENITYICTTSKLLKSNSTSTNISSRICSKVK